MTEDLAVDNQETMDNQEATALGTEPVAGSQGEAEAATQDAKPEGPATRKKKAKPEVVGAQAEPGDVTSDPVWLPPSVGVVSTAATIVVQVGKVRDEDLKWESETVGNQGIANRTHRVSFAKLPSGRIRVRPESFQGPVYDVDTIEDARQSVPQINGSLLTTRE